MLLFVLQSLKERQADGLRQLHTAYSPIPIRAIIVNRGRGSLFGLAVQRKGSVVFRRFRSEHSIHALNTRVIEIYGLLDEP